MKNIEIKGLEDGDLNKYTIKKLSQIEGGQSNKGKKHSEETKKKWSEAHKGKKLSQEHVEKVITKGKQTKWLQLLEKYPKDIILAAIEKHGNHQQKICEEMGYTFYTHKKLCNHYGIDIKKKSNYEKTEFARTKQSEPILVWQCSKREPFRPIGKPKEYYSVSFCCNSFEPKLHKGNMLRNMNNGTPYRGMFFKKK